MPLDKESSSPLDTSSGSTGSVNTPDLTPSGKVKRHAISSITQAKNVIRSLQEAARERNVKNARIMAKYNSEKPYTTEQLKQDGVAWKSNFTTKPLPVLIDKVAPRFSKAVESAKYLTNSAFPEDSPGASEKTEAFRREITATIRARPGWANLISEIAQENALFGFTSVAWLDEFHWFPKHFRQDNFFVPTGTGQLPDSAQVVALRETFLVHELFSLIEDMKAAESMGWVIENTINAINAAMPEDRRSKESGWERVYEDLIRECNVGLSHEAGALVVSVWNLLAQELSGKISHYILLDSSTSNSSRWKTTTDKNTLLFERDEQYDSMKQAVAFYSFQQGNGKLHGSKGIGREIYNMASMLDKARNEVVDRLNLSGKIIVQGDVKALRKFKMSVVGNALLIGQEFSVSERKIDAAVEPFLTLDQFLTSILDQMAGAVTPRALEGERVTAAAVNLLAGREEEGRDNIISRFLTQFASMVSTLQKRMCDPKTADDDAKEMQERLLMVMTREELDMIAKRPVAETVRDYTELERQQVVLAAQEGRGNSLYNQKELERRKLTAQISEEFANAVLLPDEDPTETAEQTRLQMMELLIIAGQGAEVPISARDNHTVHLSVLLPAMEAAAPAAAQSPQGAAILKAMFLHAKGHFDAAVQAGADKNEMKPVGELLSQIEGAIQQLDQVEAQQAQLAAQQAEEISAEIGGPEPSPTDIA